MYVPIGVHGGEGGDELLQCVTPSIKTENRQAYWSHTVLVSPYICCFLYCQNAQLRHRNASIGGTKRNRPH